jgi:hypothetical protein
MRFDAIGRLAELNVVGIVKDVGAFVRDKLLFRGVRVDAAHLLSKSMEDVQVRGLLERHLTERELELLDRDANWK